MANHAQYRKFVGCISLLWLGLQGLTVQAAVSPMTPLPQLAYPTPDTALGEQLYPNEAVYTAQIAQTIKQTLRQKYSTGTAHRDAHLKQHVDRRFYD